MDLKKISRKYDDDPLYDAYTGDYLYKGQFATYEGGQLDGSFIRRRTVSLSPDFELPPRRVVTLFDEQWILSDPIVDGFNGRPIRQTMSARKAHGLYEIITAAEILVPGTRTAYAFCRWANNTGDASTSNTEPFFEFSFSATEESVTHKFIRLNNQLWHAKMSAEIAEGFLYAEADLLAEDLDKSSRTFLQGEGKLNPVTYEYEGQTEVSGVVVNRYQFFTKKDQDQQNNYHGDKTLITANPMLSRQNLKHGNEEWSIVGVENLEDGKAVHIRKV